jgi:hypothetical protein
MSVKGSNQPKDFPLPKGTAAKYAKMAVDGLAVRVPEDRKGNKTYIFENVGGMKEIGITSLDPPAGYMRR